MASGITTRSKSSNFLDNLLSEDLGVTSTGEDGTSRNKKSVRFSQESRLTTDAGRSTSDWLGILDSSDSLRPETTTSLNVEDEGGDEGGDDWLSTGLRKRQQFALDRESGGDKTKDSSANEENKSSKNDDKEVAKKFDYETIIRKVEEESLSGGTALILKAKVYKSIN